MPRIRRTSGAARYSYAQEATRLRKMSASTAPGFPSPSPTPLPPQIAERLKRDGNGLVAAVIQQHNTREVLMLGWMDDEALHRTLTTGRVTFFSRSRQEYWRKGDTSGDIQLVRSVFLDCDGDALLITVDQHGPACHTGTRACFDGRQLPTGQDLPNPTDS